MTDGRYTNLLTLNNMRNFSSFQIPEYLHAFEVTLQKLSNLKAIPHVRHVEFSWIPPLKAEKLQPSSANSLLVDGQKFGDTEIMVTFTEDDPFQIKDKDLLKVAMYAWDGNSFPGNEYWKGQLSSTGDSAAASCSQIPQLQNAYINKPNICANNLYIASPDFGVLHINDYVTKKLKSLNAAKRNSLK